MSELRGEDEIGENEVGDIQGADGESKDEVSPDSGADGEESAGQKTESRPDKITGQESGGGTGESAGPETDNVQNPADRERIYVHVCGAVVSPGVYEMLEGSRFYEAVDAAGGFSEDACQDYLNMAALLADGSRLEIPTLGEIQEQKAAEGKEGLSDGNSRIEKYSYYTMPEVSLPEVGAVGSSESELVNINTADVAGLCVLPGVGESRAKAIIEYREKQGGFQKKEDIMEVSGIGEKMYAKMEEYLTVE